MASILRFIRGGVIALLFLFPGLALAESCSGVNQNTGATFNGTCSTIANCTPPGVSNTPTTACSDSAQLCCVGGGTGGQSSSSSASGSGCSDPANFTKIGGVCIPTSSATGGLSDKPVIDILVNLMKWLLAILGILGIIGFVISGVQYLVSAGDEHLIETAKRNMKYCIIGIIVALSGFVIIQAINSALNATTLF